MKSFMAHHYFEHRYNCDETKRQQNAGDKYGDENDDNPVPLRPDIFEQSLQIIHTFVFYPYASLTKVNIKIEPKHDSKDVHIGQEQSLC